MAVLSKYFASQAFDRIKVGLTPALRGHAGKIIELLDSDDTVSVATLHSELFELSTTISANSQLNRLIAAVNKAAEEAGTSLRIAISADKKLGKARRVWFEGDTPDPPKAITAELNAASGSLIDRTRGAIEEPCVVLLTFNDHERGKLLGRFADLGPPNLHRIDDVEYRRLGELGGIALIHRHSHDQGQLAAAAVTGEAIGHWSPRVVFAVGIAMGLLDPPEQEIGDVLVSEAAHDFEKVRKNGDGTKTPRGNDEAVFRTLLDRIRDVDLASEDDPAWPRLHVGRILCGNALVDHQPSRKELQDFSLPSVGYDMESYGIAEAAARAETHWIVIKGISDRGDGRKGKDKNNSQKLAAENAATVARRVLERGDLPGLRGTNRILFAKDQSKSLPRVDLMKLPEADDLFSGGALIESPRGAPASMAKEQAPAQGTGVPVMDYLMEWIDDPDAPNLFALLGEYGMGKTVTCQRLAQSLDLKRQADPTRPLPLYFDLRNIAGLDNRVPNLPEILADCIGRGWSDGSSAQQYTLDDVFEYMDRGAVVIFDGLDEVLVKLREHDGSIFTQTLLKLLADYELRKTAVAPAKILISCRTQYFKTLSHQRNHFTGEERGERRADSFRSMVLLPLSDEQTEEYLLKSFPDVALDRLMDLIESVHNLTELSRRPFTLQQFSFWFFCDFFLCKLFVFRFKGWMRVLDKLIAELREVCSSFEDKRRGRNCGYTMADIGLAAFSVFFMQSPSFLAHQKAFEARRSRSNCASLFGMEKIATDNHIRDMLDPVAPEAVFGMFDRTLEALETGGGLADFRRLGDRLLVALDGTAYHSSRKISCPKCSRRKRSDGGVECYHQMLCGVLVAPGHNRALPLAPEFIAPQDGAAKQDCESRAARRWLAAHGPGLARLKPVYLGDDLYSRQPICDAVQDLDADFLFVAKPNSHPTLWEWLSGIEAANCESRVKKGRRFETHRFRWLEGVPIRDGKDALPVNRLEIEIVNAAGKVTYRNSWVTSLPVDRDKVAELAACGRARWKVENESFNVLKTKGYNLEHNFGHGKNNLAALLATMNLLAFAIHTLCDLTATAWQKARQRIGARKRFFQHLAIITGYLLFPNWDTLIRTLADGEQPP